MLEEKDLPGEPCSNLPLLLNGATRDEETIAPVVDLSWFKLARSLEVI
jgi:hypothetical protein